MSDSEEPSRECFIVDFMFLVESDESDVSYDDYEEGDMGIDIVDEINGLTDKKYFVFIFLNSLLCI